MVSCGVSGFKECAGVSISFAIMLACALVVLWVTYFAVRSNQGGSVGNDTKVFFGMLGMGAVLLAFAFSGSILAIALFVVWACMLCFFFIAVGLIEMSKSNKNKWRR